MPKVQQSPPVEPPVKPTTTLPIPDSSAVTWKTYSNEEFGFSFKYPPDHKVIGDDLSPPKEGRPSFAVVHRQDIEPMIRIYWPTSGDPAVHPTAITLEDYKKNYTNLSFDIVIHKQEEMIIAGLLALKQTFSAGPWIDDAYYGRRFDTKTEYGDHRSFRYVFFDGDKKFVILRAANPASYRSEPTLEALRMSAQNEVLLDSIANTFQFIR